jgi:hypothetical protein
MILKRPPKAKAANRIKLTLRLESIGIQSDLIPE